MAITKDEELIIRGCDPIKEIIIPNEEDLDIINYLSNLPVANKTYKIHRMALKDILCDAKYFLNEEFQLHKIPALRAHKIPVVKTTINTISNIYPYKLPLEFVPDSTANGAVLEVVPIDKTRILFKAIAIGDTISELSSASYIHEVTHTQIDSIKNSIKNYYNQEVISIFLELVFSHLVSEDERLLRVEEANRIFELDELSKQQIEFSSNRLELSREDQIENSKYIQSDFIALNLFSKYYFGNTALRKEMLKDIQSIFNSLITVEDYLDKYEVSYENSKDKEKIKKYINRVV